MMNLILTSSGTPLLAITTQATRFPTPAPFTGSLTLLPDKGVVSVSAPSGLFSSATISAPGFTPDIIAHLRSIPGVWCVAVNERGRVFAEWPACHAGTPASSILPLFSDTARPGKARSPYAAALSEGIYSVSVPHTWPLATEPPEQAQLPPGIQAVLQTMAAVAASPVPPAGGFFGTVADPLAQPEGGDPALKARLDAATEALAGVVINGVRHGESLLGIRSWGVATAWASPDTPRLRSNLSSVRKVVTPAQSGVTSEPTLLGGAPPPCGWDWATRTVYLAPGLPPSLDAAWLGAGLYAAYSALSGQSFAAGLVRAVMKVAPGGFPSPTELVQAAANEAARGWLLLAEIARALPAASRAVHSFATMPLGATALALIPPVGLTIDSNYDAILGAALPRAAAGLVAHLTPRVTDIHSEAISAKSAWHDLKRRASPIKPSFALPVSATKHKSIHMTADWVITAVPGQLPQILCATPGFATVTGLGLRWATGTIDIELGGGVGCVVLTGVEPGDLRILSNHSDADIIFEADGKADAAQRVPIHGNA